MERYSIIKEKKSAGNRPAPGPRLLLAQMQILRLSPGLFAPMNWQTTG